MELDSGSSLILMKHLSAHPWIHHRFLSSTPKPIFCMECTTFKDDDPPKSHAVNASGLKFTVPGRRQFSISCLDLAPHG